MKTLPANHDNPDNDETTCPTCKDPEIKTGSPNSPDPTAATWPGAPIKVLIADDHPLVLTGIRQCINENEGMEVVGETGTAQGVFDFLAQSKCDILVLDIRLPDKSGLEVLRVLKTSHPALPVLILTTYQEERFSQYCLSAGAKGFLGKTNAASHLVAAIREVNRGGIYVYPAPGTKKMLSPGSQAPVPPYQALSEQEFHIFCHFAGGKSQSAIAAELGLSLKALRAQKARILKIMGMTRTTEIVAYARTHQLCN